MAEKTDWGQIALVGALIAIPAGLVIAARRASADPDPAALADARGIVWEAYQELYRTSRPDEQDVLRHTSLWVDHRASQWEVDVSGAGTSDNLLGLFLMEPSWPVPRQMTVYVEACDLQGVRVKDVALHELGHVLQYDHTLRPAAVGSAHDGRGSLTTVGGDLADHIGHDHQRIAAAAPDLSTPAATLAAPARVWGHACPLCALHDRLAIAERLAYGLRFRSQVEQRIPPGLGGTVVGIRATLDEALDLVPAAANAAGPALTSSDLRKCADLIGMARQAWDGWQTPETVSTAWSITQDAWWCVYRMDEAYFGGGASVTARLAMAA